MSHLYHSHSPKTASDKSSGQGCSVLYQTAYSFGSLILKSALRSITLTELLIKGNRNPADVACGRQEKTQSTAISAVLSGASRTLSQMPFTCGNTALSFWPAYDCEDTNAIDACACLARSLTSSMPVYPVAPRIPAVILFAMAAVPFLWFWYQR